MSVVRPGLAGRLEALWWEDEGAVPAPGRAALAGLAALFRTGVAAREAAHRLGLARPHRAPLPVASVGNLAVGGAGKTPAAIAVARRLQARGHRVAVLSRGYGASSRAPRVVADFAGIRLPAAAAGDEPFLVARRLPGVAVLCGPDRAALAGEAKELGATALVLDDGFQHRRLARDLEVVALDAARPFGNGRLLPRGPNREPASALARADLAWLSRADQADPAALERLRSVALARTGRPPVESRHAVVDVLDGELARSLGTAALRGLPVLLLCALARPDGFRATARSLGAEVREERVFRDHHPFTPTEIEAVLAAAARSGCARVVTTEKDAVRLPASLARDPALCAVRVEAEVLRGGAELDALLAERIG